MHAVQFHNKVIVIVVDGSEQKVQCPKSKLYEQLVYSGKKRQHSFTLLLACSPQGRIYFISKSYPGSYNDVMLFNFPENYFWHELDREEFIAADKGFIGLDHMHSCLTPIKKMNGQPLTDAEETFNHEFASHWCIVENVFSRIKQWKCCTTMFKCDERDLQASLVNSYIFLLLFLQ
jgi:hypothetical protein